MNQMIIALLVALRAVESSGGTDPRADGNDYQITRVCVDDVNRIYHTRYRYPQCVKNREDAENIVILYLTYYGMQYAKDYRRVPTTDVLARIYNAGYSGFKRGRGKHYARKVRKATK